MLISFQAKNKTSNYQISGERKEWNFPDCLHGLEHVIHSTYVTLMLIIEMAHGDRCNQVCTQCPAGPNQSPSTPCILDRCQVLAHFPFVNTLVNLLSRQNWLINLPITGPHLHIFAKQIHSVGVTFGPARNQA